MADIYIYHEPKVYSFQNIYGHDGKVFDTNSKHSNFLIVECSDKLRVTLTQNECEFSYYVLQGSGYFVIVGKKYTVNESDLIIIPARTKYSFGGKLKMLLINTPHWSPNQQDIES